MNFKNKSEEEAFVVGFLNKQAEAGLEKEAFLPALINLGLGLGGTLGGSILGQQLLRKLGPGAAKKARSSMMSRAAARNGGAAPKFIKDKVTGKVSLDGPASVSFLGRGYDSALGWLSKRKNSMNLMDQSGMAVGGVIGSQALTPFMMKEE
jgi:hypothetical protein